MWRYGDRLRELRAERRMSLRDVEERGGPNKDTMSLAERGVHRPNAQTIGKIAQAFGVSVAELRTELEEGEARPKATALPWLAEWLEERCGHAYLALPKGEFEEMFDQLPEDAPERRTRALAVNHEYNVFCRFPRNMTPAERLVTPRDLWEMIRDVIPEVAVKHGIALMEGGLDREYQEEAALVFALERALDAEADIA